VSVWSEVRSQARLRHQELIPTAPDLVAASELIAAASAATGVTCKAVTLDDPLLDGGVASYNRDARRIYYSNATEPALAAFHIAHEFAHHWLDISAIQCKPSEIDEATPAEPEMSLVGEADAYSPKERAEAQANLFAREFLLPRDKVRVHYLNSLATAESIATLVGVPPFLVMQQLADALLLPPERPQTALRKEPDPDPSQQSAINAGAGPHRVRASPGTGKTRTLVGRVKKLVVDGVDPASILVLTYSNLASQDLASRIRSAVGEASVAIWTGTFHAYGLELLRKFSIEAGFKEQPRLLDRAGSLALLEDLLPEIAPEHYLDLREPLVQLRGIAALISRAKDELAPPARFEELARAMLASPDEDEREEGSKALEVARTYDLYEKRLRANDLVDFGDLIARPIELFREKPSVRDSVRLLRPHVLVDEYQDMNRASALLLKDLVVPGNGPWVVGDVRQSIYRFRGASPTNMSSFGDDFPGAATSDLRVNYRSGGRIVRTFEAFGVEMAGHDAPLGKIEPSKGEAVGSVDYHVAATPDAEYEGIAKTVVNLTQNGEYKFVDQAIIARSHTTLARLSKHLEACRIPCLYFGDFFERPEIRDMLSLLSLVGEPRGLGFYRVAQFSNYAVPQDDIAKIMAWRHEKADLMLNVVRHCDQVPGLSDSGREAVASLATDLGDLDYVTSVHQFLLSYLFGGARHLVPLLADASVPAQQRKLAIYQLLQFGFGSRAPLGSNPKRAFLEQVRRLEMLDEEKQLRQLPAAATGIDAVRMMTVHASKGLEFPVVHIPFLTSRHFPTNRRDLNPPPKGLVEDSALMGREAEEESLFFVALSRAEHGLSLSRAICHGGGSWKNVSPSPYLTRIAKHLPQSVLAAADWIDEGVPPTEHPKLKALVDRAEWPVQALETYRECPRRFYYEYVLELGGDGARSPYRSFYAALRSSIGALRELPTPDARRQASADRLAAEWNERGPTGDKLEGLYRAAAEQMVDRAIDLLEGRCLPTDLSFSLAGGVIITCRADHVGETGGGILIRRLKAGRLASRETDRARYVVMQAAIRKAHGGKVRFEHASLLDGERKDKTSTQKKIETELQALRDAVGGIAAGEFPPDPDDYRCPRCPYYFICPSHGPLRPVS
jgi:superfamily I DNA/RNA helicase